MINMDIDFKKIRLQELRKGLVMWNCKGGVFGYNSSGDLIRRSI